MVRPLENCAAREVLFLLAVFFALFVVARLGYRTNNILDLRVGVISTHAHQQRDRVVRDELAVVGPALNLLDLDGVECINAKLRIEVVDVEVLEQWAGGHLEAVTGRRSDGRRSDRTIKTSGRHDADAGNGRRCDGSL